MVFVFQNYWEPTVSHIIRLKFKTFFKLLRKNFKRLIYLFASHHISLRNVNKRRSPPVIVLIIFVLLQNHNIPSALTKMLHTWSNCRPRYMKQRIVSILHGVTIHSSLMSVVVYPCPHNSPCTILYSCSVAMLASCIPAALHKLSASIHDCSLGPHKKW